MAYTTTTASTLMRQKLDPAIHMTFQQDDTTFAMFEEDVKSERVHGAGRDFVFDVGINASFGSLTEGANMPTVGSPSFVKGTLNYTRQWKSGEISVDILKMGSDQDFIERAVGENSAPGPIQRDTRAFRKVLNEFIFETGNGAKAVIATGGISGTNITMGGNFLARKIPVGMRAQFYTTGGTQRTGGSVTVSTVTAKSGAVVTFDAVPSDIAATDLVVYENSYNRAPYGLGTYVTDASSTILTSINTATYTDLKASVVDAASADVSPGLMDQMVTKVANRCGYNIPANDFVLVSHRAQQDKYRAQGYSLTRNVSASGNAKLDLGFPDVAHNGMRWKADIDCDPSDIWALRLKTWRIEYLEKPGIFEVGGDKLFLKPGSGIHAAALLYYIHAMYNLATVAPHMNGRIKSLAFSSSAV